MPKKVKVEVLPPGIAIGAIPTMVDRWMANWSSTYRVVGVGAQMKGAKRKKSKRFLRYGRGGG